MSYKGMIAPFANQATTFAGFVAINSFGAMAGNVVQQSLSTGKINLSETLTVGVIAGVFSCAMYGMSQTMAGAKELISKVKSTVANMWDDFQTTGFGQKLGEQGGYINLASIADNYGDDLLVQGAGSVDDFLSSNVPKQFQTQVKNAFGSDVKVSTLAQDTTVYRYYGGDSAASSYWVTPTKVSNPISELALPSGNTAQHVDSIILPKGITILEGTVAPNFGQPGGGYQYYVPNIR